jgi:hypothetical protein
VLSHAAHAAESQVAHESQQAFSHDSQHAGSSAGLLLQHAQDAAANIAATIAKDINTFFIIRSL